MWVFRRLKQRATLIRSVSGETTGCKLNWRLPLVEAGVDSRFTVLGWAEVGEVDARQDEHHRLQHLLSGSTGRVNLSHRAGGRTGRIQSRWGGRWRVKTGGGVFGWCVFFSFGGGDGRACQLGVRDGTQGRLQTKCFEFLYKTETIRLNRKLQSKTNSN